MTNMSFGNGPCTVLPQISPSHFTQKREKYRRNYSCYVIVLCAHALLEKGLLKIIVFFFVLAPKELQKQPFLFVCMLLCVADGTRWSAWLRMRPCSTSGFTRAGLTGSALKREQSGNLERVTAIMNTVSAEQSQTEPVKKTSVGNIWVY